MDLDDSSDISPSGRPLELLFERAGLPIFSLPAPLAAIYGGTLGFCNPRLFANFVTSLDGVVALPGDTESGQIISGRNQADRFVMGLLRACADAVLVGAGTLRKSPGHLWSAEQIYPRAAVLFAQMRQQLGLAAQPRLVLISASGMLDTTQPAIQNAYIFTTARGEAALRGRVPQSARVSALGSERVHLPDVVRQLRAEGVNHILTEGGPSLFGELVHEQLIDELFLTSAPALFGRYTDDGRKSLASGLDLSGTKLELIGARKHGSHLFFRYEIAARP